MSATHQQTNAKAKTFAALADENRLKIMRAVISDDGICVSELATALDMSVSGAWQHLKVLEDAGLLEEYKIGRKTCHRISANPEVQTIIQLI